MRGSPPPRRDGTDLHVRGLDMLDGTPILDIKPYLSSIPEETLRRGWFGEAEALAERSFQIDIERKARLQVEAEKSELEAKNSELAADNAFLTEAKSFGPSGLI